MKSLSLAVVLILTAVCACIAQANAKPVDELETLSNSWMTALKDHDTKTLELLMADNYRLVHPSQDKVTNRAEWLAAGRTIEVKSFSYQHLKVDRYGSKIAVVSAILIIDALKDGKPWPAPKTSVIDVWEKRHGKWQVVTRYATRPEEIRPPRPAS